MRLLLASLLLLAAGCDDSHAPAADARSDLPEASVPDARAPDGAVADSAVADSAAPGDQSAVDSGPRVPDPSTLSGKVMFGYQGWFSCPGVGSPVDSWMHWFKGQTPTAANATVDMLPDVGELGAGERCPTQMTLASGMPVEVYSSHNPATVMRHSPFRNSFCRRCTIEAWPWPT